MAIVYMPLLNEGVEVWRPVEATPLTNETYRVEGEIPEGEEWLFAPGTVIRCEWKTLSDGDRLTAIGVVG
jgi:hypothetical protein